MEDFEQSISQNHIPNGPNDIEESVISISSEEEIVIYGNQTTPERNNAGRNSLLKQLSTTLSPKLTNIEPSEGRVSRYGRQQKPKDLDDGFIPTEITKFVSKSGSKTLKPVSLETLRKIKTPKKIYPSVLDNNNESSEKGPEEKSIEVDVSDESEENLPTHSLTHEYNLNEDVTTNEQSPEDTLDTTEDTTDQLSDSDSGRGSSIDTEFASLAAHYKEGEIYWAEYKVNYWWPCLIAPDPDGIMIKMNSKMKSFDIHVKYFADLRAWIPVNRLVPYEPLEEFQKTHKVKTKAKVKLWPKALTLASSFVDIPIEERNARFDAQVEEDKQARKVVRKSKEKVTDTLNRSSTPESPAYEDISRDRETVKSDLNHARELALQARKRSRSLSVSAPEIHPKRTRYSQRAIEIRNKPVPEPSVSHNMSLPIMPKKERKVSVESEEDKYKDMPIEERLKLEYITQGFNHTHLYSHHSIKKEYVCRLCYFAKGLTKCVSCKGYFHEDCANKQKLGEPIPVLKRGPIGSHKSKKGKHAKKRNRTMSTESVSAVNIHTRAEQTSAKTDFICHNCETGENQRCFICKVKAENLMTFQCSQKGCMRFYHKACVDEFPQTTNNNDDTFICPYHKCHSCFASDINSITPESKLVTCVMCPTSYHYNDVHCIPAGTEFLTTIQIICPNHSIAPPSNINVNWCFVCSKAGSLICCETCPGAFHLECVKINQAPDGKYFCDNCKAGQRPIYNEVAWAKMGIYRFWPAIILPPMAVPLAVLDNFHYPNDFCVKFFGTRDYAWVSRDRVFTYQEGDHMSKAHSDASQKALSAAYKEALVEAKLAYEMLKSEKQNNPLKKAGKPDPYVKIKTNRAVPPVKLEMDIDAANRINTECTCKPTDPDPCGYTSQCLNRSSKQECNPLTCPAREKCQNVCFSKKLYPKLKEKYTANKGWGLITEEDLPEGSFVIEYVGEVINTEEMNRRLAIKYENKDDNYYFMELQGGHIIDAEGKGNLARFINHSCEPNCITELWQIGRTVRVGIFAVRDIRKGEELSFDYQLECKGDVQKKCMCGTENCRGYIGPKKREERFNSNNSIRSSTPKVTKTNKSMKRKNSMAGLSNNKRQRKDSTLVEIKTEEASTQLSTSVTIDDDIDVKTEYFVPEQENEIPIEGHT